MQPDLLVEGETVRVTGRDQALVKAQSTDGWYMVELDDEMGIWRCTCKGYEHKGRCRHVNTVQAFAEGKVHGVPLEG